MIVVQICSSILSIVISMAPLKQGRVERLCYYTGLTVSTLIFIFVCIANGLGNSSHAENFGFVNTTTEVSHLFFTQVSL